MKRLILIPFFVSLVLTAQQVSADELTAKAEQLLNTEQAAAAYELLIAELDKRAGTPDYDLLLGIAALNSGKPTQAVFALERVLAVDPDNARARLELGRAYYEMGENEASREEFNQAKSGKLPTDVVSTIEQYLTSIDSRLAPQSRLNFYIQGRAGYDSNVNSATDTSTVAIPAFGNLVFNLDNSARELDSGFYEIDAGGSFSQPLFGRRDLSMFGAANLFYRPTWNENDFDTGAINAQLGMRYLQGDNAWIASLLGQKYVLDGTSNRNQAGINLQWLRKSGERTQYSVFAQGLVQRYPGQEIRNVNQYSGGGGIVHALQAEGDPIIYLSVFAGTDSELNDSRPDIGRDFAGVRTGGQYTLREDLNLVGSASYQYSRYGGDDPLFRERRRDHFVALRTALEYAFNDNWVISPEVQYLINDSSLIINDFDRWQVLATVRYNF